jgi:hypothetical protein
MLGSRVRVFLANARKMHDTCDASASAVGVSFHCYRPRHEPHLTHVAFALSPNDPNKSFTFSWEDGNKKRRLIVHPNEGSEESHSALESYGDGSYHYHGDDSDDFPLGKW